MKEMLKEEAFPILLVEDDDDHAELVMRNLESYEVADKIFRVADGRSALNYLYRKEKYSNLTAGSKPQLILLDIRIPKINGLEVLKEIKSSSELKNIPVVILTSSQDEKDVNLAYDNYVNSYLVKPIDYGSFAKLMRDLGYYWIWWNIKPINNNTEHG